MEMLMKLWLIYQAFYCSSTKQGFFKLSDAKEQWNYYKKKSKYLRSGFFFFFLTLHSALPTVNVRCINPKRNIFSSFLLET